MEPVDNRFSDLTGIIADEDELARHIGTPPQKVLAKVTDRLDELSQTFIARSPFCLIATAGADGHIDISPKGDPPGFARVLDDQRLAIPDRPGNRRVDSFRNLLQHPRIGLLFLVPGKGETLRLRGEARITSDSMLRRSMAIDGKVPALALVVHVHEVFVHCPKRVIRSGLLQAESWTDSSDLPDIVQAMIRHAKLDMTPDALFEEAEREGLTKLY